MQRRCTDATRRNIEAMPPYNGFAPALTTAIHDAINGKPMSLKRERRMCEALGLEPPPVMVETPACPDCGSVHNGGRCNGQPVTVRLVRQRQPPPAWVAEATANLAALLERKHQT